MWELALPTSPGSFSEMSSRIKRLRYYAQVSAKGRTMSSGFNGIEA